MHEESRGSKPDECKGVEATDKKIQNNYYYQIIH